MNDYEFAYEFAKRMHSGQVDKAGVDYFQHPLCVSEKVHEPIEKVVALLHDVVEDTPVSVGEIRKMFGDVVGDAIQCLTHKKSEDYMDYIKRVGENKIATKVKMADISHNMDLSRLKVIDEKAIQRVNKYVEAMAYLKDCS